MYGYGEDVKRVVKLKTDSSKMIYNELMYDIICRNNSIIPSRNEKRTQGIKWAVAWKNWSKLRGISPQEREFAWKVQQDMILVGARLHRPNAERRCMEQIGDNIMCLDLETRQHAIAECEGILDIYSMEHLIRRKPCAKNCRVF